MLFLTSGSGSALTVRRLVWALEGHDVQVVVAPSVTDVSGDRIRVRPVGGLPLMHLEPPRATDASRWGKRLFDLVGSALLLVLFSPVLLVAAVRVKAHDGGPVLFRQTRIGRHGEEFACLKLRTMVVDAEDRLAALRAEQGYVDGAEGLFKLKDDPRITRPGRWLRKWSFDELPQLLNVLRGDMSLVGPRPPLPSEVAAYASDTARRLHVRPGLTGLWQVSGRSDLTWDEAVRLDLYYVDNWSMVQDLTILAPHLQHRGVPPRGVLRVGPTSRVNSWFGHCRTDTTIRQWPEGPESRPMPSGFVRLSDVSGRSAAGRAGTRRTRSRSARRRTRRGSRRR